jgi:hypothetical protein
MIGKKASSICGKMCENEVSHARKCSMVGNIAEGA